YPFGGSEQPGQRGAYVQNQRSAGLQQSPLPRSHSSGRIPVDRRRRHADNIHHHILTSDFACRYRGKPLGLPLSASSPRCKSEATAPLQLRLCRFGALRSRDSTCRAATVMERATQDPRCKRTGEALPMKITKKQITISMKNCLKHTPALALAFAFVSAS